MPILEQITKDFIQARKSGDANGVSTLSLLRAALKNREIELRGKGKELNDDIVLEVIVSEVKQRRDSIVSYAEAGRQDLVEQEESELSILKKYLPEQLSEEEIRTLVLEAISSTGATSVKEMGKVMGVLMPKVKGKADGGKVSAIVKGALSE